MNTKRRQLIAEALRAGAIIHQQGGATRITLRGKTVRILPNGKAFVEGARIEHSKPVRDFGIVRQILGLNFTPKGMR